MDLSDQIHASASLPPSRKELYYPVD